MKALETKKLTKKFDGVKAVNNLSISIESGKITGIVGPNGSGKTTLINTLTGMINIDDGAVVISGASISKILPYDVPTYGITRTFQNLRLFEQMTVLDNLLVVLTERGVINSLFERHGEYHRNRAKELLEMVDLWSKRNELVVNLSYGQRKLVEITRALAMDTDIYLFDEPFAGLFRDMRKTVEAVIKKLKDEQKTIVLIEHDMVIIRELTDYVFVLDGGALLAEGTPETVLADKEVIEAYLGT